MKSINLRQPPSLDHLKRLTTRRGLFQHSCGSQPDWRHGYSIDDNARALIVAYLAKQIFGNEEVLQLGQRYFNYILRAQLANGCFHNFMDANGHFLDKKGSQDSQGRTIWALGYVASHPEIDRRQARLANQLLARWQPNIGFIRYLRAKAFVLLGYYYLGQKDIVAGLANDLVAAYEDNRTATWHWFDEKMTYSNAILPYSLWLADRLVANPKYRQVAEESLNFLQTQCLVKGIPAPIGQNGWYHCKGERAVFDQQMVDGADMVLAMAAAAEATGNKQYRQWAEEWLAWFHGNNIGGIPLVDGNSGGCFDGLTPSGVNPNQGAESIVCYLLAYLTLAGWKLEKKI